MGLDLTHHDVGPALVKHVTIDGFDVGSQIHYQEYSMTLEQITLRNQKVVGIRNRGNILAIRQLHSDNTVTAIEGEGPNSMITLLDSELLGGSPDHPAIRSDGALYALRVKTRGYRSAIEKRTLVNQKTQSGPRHVSRDRYRRVYRRSDPQWLRFADWGDQVGD